MWNSIEGLSRLFYGSQWAMAILGALTALAIVFSIIVSVRKDRLVDEKAVQDARDHEVLIQTQNHQISTLNEQLGEARDNLQELNSQRTLSPEQKRIIVDLLRKSPRESITIIKTEDLETHAFAAEIEATLGQGNWLVVPPPFMMIDHVEPGVMVMVHDRNRAPKGFAVLLNALAEAKVPVRGVSSRDVDEGQMILWIGPKEKKR
jgi:hypothetical protein